MKKIRIAVLMGGPSAEHDVSLKSGQMVLKNLNSQKYAAKSIVIKRNGQWPISLLTLKKKFDVVFIAMHGEYGEDGVVQSILEKAKITFTGSGSKASKTGMDKNASGKLFKKFGLNVPLVAIKLPMVVKPADRGSSVGVSIVKNLAELPKAVAAALRYSPNVLIQQFISGREFTCGVLEIEGQPLALPPTEIIPKLSTFFDFNAKYQVGASNEITPPNLNPQKIKAIQKAAFTAHKAIGARGFSRTDIIMDKYGKIYVLEINTIPGMTATSLLPQQAKAFGINFSELLDIIIEGVSR